MYENYLKEHKIKGLKHFKIKDVTRLKLPWATKDNKVDCGVFVMRHMETYFGDHPPHFITSLSEESDAQQK